MVELTAAERVPLRERTGFGGTLDSGARWGSKQIAVRLPDDLVDFLDKLVASGDEASRASIVTRALKRETKLDLTWPGSQSRRSHP